MIKVQYLGLSPVDVEGFPKGTERMKQGAIHLKPNKVYQLSDGEFAFIKKLRPDLKFHEFKPEKKFEPKVKPEAKPAAKPKGIMEPKKEEKTLESKGDKK